MEKLVIRSVVKYTCKKVMPLEKLHEDYTETLGKEPPSYTTVKKWATEFKRGKEFNVDDLAAQKIQPLMKMSRLGTSRLCMTCES